MGGRATRRRGVRPEQLDAQRRGIAELNNAFGYTGAAPLLVPTYKKRGLSAERMGNLLATLGFGSRQKKGDAE